MTKQEINWRHLILELFVVFLGITAGFILNNWRGNANQIKLEQQYLQGFEQEFTSHIDALQNSTETDSIWLARANPLIVSLAEARFNRDSTKAVFDLLMGFSRFSAVKGTWEDITNSGNLNLIRDFQLKGLIVDYYMSIQNVDFLDNYMFDYFDESVMSFLMSEYIFAENRIRNPEINKKIKFANVFTIYYGLIEQRHSAYSELLQESMTLHENLTKSIKP